MTYVNISGALLEVIVGQNCYMNLKLYRTVGIWNSKIILSCFHEQVRALHSSF